MADKKFFVDVNLQGNNINNLRADTLDITSNLASANTKRIVYWSDQYYYSDGTTWNILATALGYTPEDEANKSTSTSLGTSDTLYPTQNAVKVYADNLLGNANALVYKGTIDCSTNPDYPAGDAGWMYIASVAGKIGGASGTDVEVGDMIICNTDGTVSGNQATVGQYWNVIQKNIVGAVTGPASSVSNNVVFFDGTTGKIIKDSGLTLSGSNTGDETTATIKTKLGIATTSVDGYLTSTDWSTFNGKQNALSGTGFVKISGTTISYDNSTYLTGNQTVTLSGDVTGSGTTGITTSISATTVTGKLITGFVSGAGTVAATDSILGAIQKLDGNTSAKIGGSGTANYLSKFTAAGTLGNSAVFESGSNVGIGTTAPTRKLDINGVSRFRNFIGIDNSDSTTRRIFFTNGDDLNTYASGEIRSSELHLYNSATKVLSVINNNIGIGTITPGSKLEVNGDVKISTIANATTNTNTFLVSDSGIVKYRTASQTLSDLGAIGLTSLTASTPLSYNNTTGAFSIQVATTSQSGYLSSTDWTTFNGKVGGSGTANYLSKFTASGTIGNSLIQDNGTYLGISTAPVTGVRVTVDGVANTAIRGNTTGNGKYGLHGSSVNDGPGTFTGVFGASTDNGSSYVGSVYVGGRFFASNGNNTTDVYSLWLQDGTESIGRFLKSITADGKSQWATLTVADTGLTLTTTGSSGAATLVGNTLNIPTYESSLIPKLQGNEIWRGHTFRNNSTTFDSTAGLTLSTTGTNTARSVATTSYAARGIRMGVTASLVATGRYTGIRGGVLLWYVSGGFLYTGEFNISDTATAAGTHNFWGLASSTSDLVIGDISNSQPSALTNIIAFANDSGDANLQIMYNDASGTATKTDLGSSFPSNRTAGAAITTIYSCYLYNAPGSTSVIYRIVNKETGATAQGTLSTNLPASTIGLNFFGVRTMGTTGGGITNSGQFDVYRLGVYSL